MREAFLKYWRGVLLAGIGAAATLWLALSGQLSLYIHPRYFVFTAVMAGITAVVVVAALLLPRQRDHAHEHEAEAVPSGMHAGWRTRAAVAGSIVLVLATAVALLAIPPSALSAQFANQRDLNAAAVAAQESPIELASADPSAFSVKDWAVLLTQGASDDYLRAATPSVDGFVIPAGDGEFTVARYVMTCCAVDAQPVGVTVALDGWQGEASEGKWVRVTGRFVRSEDPDATAAWVIEPASVEPIEQPSDPYVY